MALFGERRNDYCEERRLMPKVMARDQNVEITVRDGAVGAKPRRIEIRNRTT
jgi:hypothetical protein